MVVEKKWPALPSCKHLCYESNDLLSQLPDDILFIIMSFLTIREVARTSVLSHRWNYLWRYFPVLIFDDFTMMKRVFEDDEPTNQERSRFLKLVNRVLESHLDRYVDELRVTFDLRTIDILAPKLLSFAHHGDPIKLHIRNASLLSRLSVGYTFSDEDIVAYAFDSLSKYFSQLEYLSWSMQMRVANQQLNLGINNPPSMKKLKHLELQFRASCIQSLFGWAELIEASPLLERLTLKSRMLFDPRIGHQRIMKRIGRPLNRLKTLELDFDLGYPIDLEFATYVVENSIMLKDVIVVLRPPVPVLKDYRVEDVAAQYKKIVPHSVKLTIMKVSHWNDSILKSWKFTSLDS